MENQTTVTKFILSALSSDLQVQFFLFLVFLCIYLITLIGNMFIMLVIRTDPHLHTPMYFFLFHLSFVDICYSSAIVPKMLENFLAEQKGISVHGCLAQMYVILLMGGTEVFILSAMAYDRYAAICHPLHYVVTMNRAVCVLLLVGVWTMAFLNSLVNFLPVLRLDFCGTGEIGHFSCELPLLLPHSCTDSTINKMMLLASVVTIGLGSFLPTVISYVRIISTILKIQSAEGRQKAFSTCSSHLTVVSLFYLTSMFQYIKPSSASLYTLDELFSIQYSVLTPMLNPLIYSLKNQEVKEALRKAQCWKG
uniref:Olfactory receptor n=1 Tax=Sphenodon punctatus TaxID=8508 RepID=A0A8D0L215_SPHPU